MYKRAFYYVSSSILLHLLSVLSQMVNRLTHSPLMLPILFRFVNAVCVHRAHIHTQTQAGQWPVNVRPKLHV